MVDVNKALKTNQPAKQKRNNVTKKDISDCIGNIAEEIKNDDALMANELAVLTKKSMPNEPKKCTIYFCGNSTTCPPIKRGGRGPHTVEVKEVYSTETFIAKKREVGLMRLALANKEAEIHHLEEEMDRAEKRLRQQQEQLVSTEEKFKNFLKQSNLEQDAAVRRAEVESKAKLERLIDIKKLSAQIGHMEQDIRKTETQLDLCMEYKEFMDSLVTPQWFMDVLSELRIEDTIKQILRETQEKYQMQKEALKEMATFRNSVAERETSYCEESGTLSWEGSTAKGDEGKEVEEFVPIEKRLENLQNELAAEAEQRKAEAVERIKREVAALSIEEVREALNKDYTQERIPMFFREPSEILDVFINVEEGNLFLIQNSQELEEELERVAIEYFHEQEKMASMVRQRHAQMDSLGTRIQEAQQKLREIEERLADLENIESSCVDENTVSRGKKGAKTSKKGVDEAVVKQEVLKKRIEQVVAEIFRCINQNPTAVVRRHEDEGEVDGTKRPLKMQIRSPVQQSKKSLKKMSVEGKTKKKRVAIDSSLQGSGTAEGEASANMGPVEMLTIIENKVDEYHRRITDPENGVDDALIMSVIKARDKERRRQARVVQLEKQSMEREERNQRALERSQAPVVRRRGKPIMWRSRPPVDTVQGAELTQGATSSKEVDQDDEFFR